MVGNLRIVVSRYSRWVTRICLGLICFSSATFAQQAADPAKPAETPPAAADAAAPPAAASPAENPPPQPAAEGGQIRSKIEYAPPLLTVADERALRSKLQIPYGRATKAPSPSAAEKKTLEEWAQLAVDRMTMTEHRADLWRIVSEPAKRPTEAALTTPAAKAILLKAISDRCSEILNQKPSQHPDVQLNLVILMTSLSASVPTNKTPVPYTGSYKSIIQVLQSPDMKLESRITAANGLDRILRYSTVGVAGGDLTSVQRNEITVELVKALAAASSNSPDEGMQWFRSRLAEAIGHTGQALDLNGSSAPIDSLMAIATNSQEPLRVRVSAMRAVTQLNWNPQVNLPLILHETMKLVLEVGNANNAVVDENIKLQAALAQQNAAALAANPKAKPVPFVPGKLPAALSRSNLEVYFCFQAEAVSEKDQKLGMLNQVARPGLANPLVDEAYKLTLPIVNHLQTNKDKPVAIPNPTLKAIDDWLKAHPPADRKVTSVSPAPLPAPAPAP